MDILFLIIGLIVLVLGGEFLVKGAVGFSSAMKISPLIIGMTVVAFGTSAPELIVSLTSSLDGTPDIAVGNVVGSNVANLSLVFGSMLLILAYKKLNISQDKSILINLLILLASSLLVWFLIATNPFSIYTSAILLCCLISVILFWYKNSNAEEIDSSVTVEKNVFLKLLLSLVVLVFAAWLITHGANLILDQYNLGQLFIGYTVLAIGTSLPEIAASVSLALKGRYETVSGTLIGSNIFNGLCVLAIPGLFMRPEMSSGWSYSEWSPLLFLLFLVTLLFAFYIFMLSRKEQKAGFFLSFIFLSTYFFSLYYAF